jgi:hypothetical protein
MAKKFDPKKDLRNRVAASEKFARRDETYTSYNESTGKPYTVKPKRGEYVPLYDDVTKFYNEIVKYGHEGRGGGDFPEAQAKKNTIKGRQYLDSTQGQNLGAYGTLGKRVKYGTIAGPKTVTNLVDMAKARKMNEKRDKNNMMLRRGKGR